MHEVIKAKHNVPAQWSQVPPHHDTLAHEFAPDLEKPRGDNGRSEVWRLMLTCALDPNKPKFISDTWKITMCTDLGCTVWLAEYDSTYGKCSSHTAHDIRSRWRPCCGGGPVASLVLRSAPIAMISTNITNLGHDRRNKLVSQHLVMVVKKTWFIRHLLLSILVIVLQTNASIQNKTLFLIFLRMWCQGCQV